MREREPLERAVLDVLWQSSGPVTATEVARLLPGRPRAATTVLTALDRLRRKGVVIRSDGGRPHRWQAVGTREQAAAAAILDVLRESADRGLVLSRFVAEADEADVAALQHALRERSGGGAAAAAPTSG
ncbi:MAG: BlaI/MecI/CopY family transcriptional regulator [Kineosporiaceae bacterium]